MGGFHMQRTKGFLQRHTGAIQSDGSVQANDLGTPRSVVRIPLWVSIVVILGAVLTATGAVISKVDPTILTNGDSMTGAARVYADYMFARNLPLPVLWLLLLASSVRRRLPGFCVLPPLFQFFAAIAPLPPRPFRRSPGFFMSPTLLLPHA